MTAYPTENLEILGKCFSGPWQTLSTAKLKRERGEKIFILV
jgi:hypothetical protein